MGVSCIRRSRPPSNFTETKRFMNRHLLLIALSLVFVNPAFSQPPVAPSTQVESQPPGVATSLPAAEDSFRPLIQNWEAASFGGDGRIEMKLIDTKDSPETKQQWIEMQSGDPLTGVRWTGPLIRDHYELRLKAKKVDGFDFFVAVTFPVAEQHCSLVLGGWGGGILGISSIDGGDAANNETTQYKNFKTDQWYAIRIRVDAKSIKAWIDDEEWVNVPRQDHQFDIRIEMDPCLPLGIANFQCISQIKDIQIRKLTANTQEK